MKSAKPLDIVISKSAKASRSVFTDEEDMEDDREYESSEDEDSEDEDSRDEDSGDEEDKEEQEILVN